MDNEPLAPEEQGFVENMRALAYRAFERTIGTESALPSLVILMDEVNRLADAIAGYLFQSKIGLSSIACKRGCEWCCHQVVAVSAPEVIRLSEHLRESLSAAELAALRARLAGHASNRKGVLSSAPCALLVDASCLGYPVRPLICRLFHGTDAERCRRLYLRTPGDSEYTVYSLPHETALWMRHGMASAAKEIGLESTTLNLRAALHIALGPEGSAERWLAGERVFAPAELQATRDP